MDVLGHHLGACLVARSLGIKGGAAGNLACGGYHVGHDGLSALCLAFGQLFGGHADESRGGAVGLPAALTAAAAGNAVHLNDDVAQLAACIVEARNDLASKDDTAANTRAEGDHDGIGGALGGARDGLAPSGGVGIVLYEDRGNGEARLDGLADVELIEGGNVAAVLDHTRVVVGDAGGGDTHRGDLRG